MLRVAIASLVAGLLAAFAVGSFSARSAESPVQIDPPAAQVAHFVKMARDQHILPEDIHQVRPGILVGTGLKTCMYSIIDGPATLLCGDPSILGLRFNYASGRVATSY